MSVGEFETLAFAAPVGALMSRGVRTLQADDRLTAVIGYLRRLGHEGYPVLMGDPSGIVGLLTLRDADKALEHNLTDLTVREVMSGGAYALRPDDTVATLVNVMDTSGWGQIPVIQGSAVVGIVTRTDLIRHLARTYRIVSGQAAPRMTSAQIQAVLGEGAGRLIDLIADHGRERGLGLYLVGGVVRDLLLQRPNFDIDFVVESYGDAAPALHDAPNFAHALAAQYGGEVTTHPPFGTAKWRMEKTAFPGIIGDLPHHIDFATARREFYEHPTALPSVSGGSIKLDLGRRDFTINALAVAMGAQLGSSSESGQVVDFFGGLADLSNGVIRALHSLSFTDDPSRALRAVRFATRLGFTIEPRTAELIALSRPMLGRITGERLRNELTLLLQEAEPERGLADLHERGLLEAIDPQFTLDSRVPDAFQRIRATVNLPEFVRSIDRTDLYWHVLFAALSDTSAVQSISHRLLFGRTEQESLLNAAALVSLPGELSEPDASPSQIDERLRGMSETALAATWILAEDHLTRTRLEDYITKWRELRPTTNGHRLRELGLQPGPRYRHILERLRQARLDGEINSDAEEETLLKSLL